MRTGTTPSSFALTVAGSTLGAADAAVLLLVEGAGDAARGALLPLQADAPRASPTKHPTSVRLRR
jgi:hypothetical protein